MLVALSPAKKLDFERTAHTTWHTTPIFLDDAQQLIEQLRMMSVPAIARLLKISDALAKLNTQRFRDWHRPFDCHNAKQAILTFKGDVYQGLQADTWSKENLQIAQKQLRILSGLYGLLRPLDLIQPYRLEMGTKLSAERGNNLYQFWGDKISIAINQQLQAIKSNVFINLASDEYFKVLNPKLIKAKIVKPVFKDKKHNTYKIISFYAKKARGAMAAYIIRNKLVDVNAIKDFDNEGYAYHAELSTDEEWVFTRQLLMPT